MSGTALGSVQDAIHDRLTGDVTLAALIPGGVRDHAPKGTAYPYIAIGDATERPFRTFGRGGHEAVFTLDVWGEKRGFKDLQAIVDRATTILEATPLVVAGHAFVYCNFEDAIQLRDPVDDEHERRHIVARYRVITQDT